MNITGTGQNKQVYSSHIGSKCCMISPVCGVIHRSKHTFLCCKQQTAGWGAGNEVALFPGHVGGEKWPGSTVCACMKIPEILGIR